MPPGTMNVAMHKSFERLKRFIGWDACDGFCGDIKMQSGMYLAQGFQQKFSITGHSAGLNLRHTPTSASSIVIVSAWARFGVNESFPILPPSLRELKVLRLF